RRNVEPEGGAVELLPARRGEALISANRIVKVVGDAKAPAVNARELRVVAVGLNHLQPLCRQRRRCIENALAERRKVKVLNPPDVRRCAVVVDGGPKMVSAPGL